MALGNNLTKHSEEVEKPLESEPADQQRSAEKIQHEDEEDDFFEGEGELENNKRLQQFCVFRTNQEEYAIPIDLVQEVVKYRKPTPLPQMPSYILGMTNIRGNIFGVFDIERFFSLDTDVVHNYLLVLDHEVFKMTIGIPEVPDSISISEDEIENLSSSIIKSKVGQKYLKGVIKKENRMIILFDIEGIISSDNFTIAS